MQLSARLTRNKSQHIISAVKMSEDSKEEHKYSSQQYWDDMYRDKKFHVGFEWYLGWKLVETSFTPHLKPNDQILM